MCAANISVTNVPSGSVPSFRDLSQLARHAVYQRCWSDCGHTDPQLVDGWGYVAVWCFGHGPSGQLSVRQHCTTHAKLHIKQRGVVGQRYNPAACDRLAFQLLIEHTRT